MTQARELQAVALSAQPLPITPEGCGEQYGVEGAVGHVSPEPWPGSQAQLLPLPFPERCGVLILCWETDGGHLYLPAGLVFTNTNRLTGLWTGSSCVRMGACSCSR